MAIVVVLLVGIAAVVITANPRFNWFVRWPIVIVSAMLLSACFYNLIWHEGDRVILVVFTTRQIVAVVIGVVILSLVLRMETP